MNEEKIKFITRSIDGYSGYQNFFEDIKRVNQFIRDRVIRINSTIARMAVAVPPDISSYFQMTSKISGEILEFISIDYKEINVLKSSLEKLIELDHKIVEILNTAIKTLESMGSGFSLPMSREYSVILYKLTARLRDIINMRLELLGLKKVRE